MRILSNKAYRKLTNEIKAYENMYNEEVSKLMSINKDYELQIEEILCRLKEMIHPTNSKMGKDKYKEKIKDVIIFIQGKQR